MAGTSYEMINYQLIIYKNKEWHSYEGVHVITEMEAIADKVDEKDSFKEGFTIVNKQYKAFGWLYL